jgi:hypothetical protein
MLEHGKEGAWAEHETVVDIIPIVAVESELKNVGEVDKRGEEEEECGFEPGASVFG